MKVLSVILSHSVRTKGVGFGYLVSVDAPLLHRL